MSLFCPHGYTAFWDCPECEEPIGMRRAEQCGRPVVANVRRPDHTGPEYACCEAHIPWGRAQVGVPATVVRTTNITSGCVAPASVPAV